MFIRVIRGQLPFLGKLLVIIPYVRGECKMTVRNKKDAVNTEEKAVQINWDQSRLKTAYANVSNVSSTREEVSVLFGINQTMNMGQGDITIELTDRIVLNPYAAKRLALILNGVIQQYESAFGSLPIESERKPA